MKQHRTQATAQEAQELQKRQQKAAQLQYEFSKSWNAYINDKSAPKAQEVVAKGDQLLEVHKSLGGRASGALAPSQITLRMDYAKETLAKDAGTLKRSDDSPFPSYKNAKGQTVYKIG